MVYTFEHISFLSPCRDNHWRSCWYHSPGLLLVSFHCIGCLLVPKAWQHAEGEKETRYRTCTVSYTMYAMCWLIANNRWVHVLTTYSCSVAMATTLILMFSNLPHSTIAFRSCKGPVLRIGRLHYNEILYGSNGFMIIVVIVTEIM